MSPAGGRRSRDDGRRRRDRAPADVSGWRSWLPLSAVLVTLAALLVVPVLIRQQRNEVRRERIGFVEPAQTLATRLGMVYANKAVAYRNHLLTGDRAYLERYRTARRREAALIADLEPLIRRLGPEFARSLDRTLSLADGWQRGPDSLLAGTMTRAELIDRTAEQQRSYVATLDSIRSLYDRVVARTARLNARIDAVDDRALDLTFLLAALALSSAIVVVWLDRRRRRYALDVEERRRREAALLLETRRSRDELAAAVESRALLIRGFSHDVKNPLAAADGYLELLIESEGGRLPPSQLHYVDRARRSIDAAHRLTDNLVTLARVEAGQLPIERSPTDLCHVARETAEDYRGDADIAGLRLSVELPPGCPPIETDASRVAQILSNLLSNAIRYTPEGGEIVVRVALRDGERAPGTGRWACIDVSDTGPGIPADQHEAIFEEFRRSTEHRRAPGGAGLGLAIGRRLARLLGGDLDLESEPARGSTFTLWLPAADAAASPASTHGERAG